MPMLTSAMSARLNQDAVADGRVQTLRIVKYFAVIEYRRFGFFVSTEAGLMAMFLL
jgi:hypothetical protein